MFRCLGRFIFYRKFDSTMLRFMFIRVKPEIKKELVRKTGQKASQLSGQQDVMLKKETIPF